MDYLLSFQNHDVVKIQIDNVILFSQFLIVIFGGLLFVPFRRNTGSNEFMNYEFTKTLRGIAVMSIVIGHFNYYVIPDRNLLFFGNLGSYGVPIFLLLSGFAISESYKNRQLKYFFEKRFLRVCIPFILVSVLIVLFNVVLQDKTNYNLRYSITLLTGYKTVDRNFWFIHYLFYWYFVFFAVFSVIRVDKRILWIFAGAMGPFLFTSFGGIALTASLCFPMGVALSMYKDELNHALQVFFKKSVFQKLALLVSLMLILDYFIGYSIPQASLFMSSLALSAHKLGISLLMILFFVVVYRDKVSAFYQFIGGISYELYLLHGFFMYSYDFILFKFPLYVSFLVYLFVMVVMSLALNRITAWLNTLIATRVLCIVDK